MGTLYSIFKHDSLLCMIEKYFFWLILIRLIPKLFLSKYRSGLTLLKFCNWKLKHGSKGLKNVTFCCMNSYCLNKNLYFHLYVGNDVISGWKLPNLPQKKVILRSVLKNEHEKLQYRYGICSLEKYITLRLTLSAT